MATSSNKITSDEGTTSSLKEESEMDRPLVPVISDKTESNSSHDIETITNCDRRYNGGFVRSDSAVESICSELNENRHPTREDQIRAKLEYHFMNPWQKYKLRKRKPWKLMIQIIKIILVTVQVVLFATDRFAVADFFRDNTIALRHLFQRGYHDGILSRAYTREDVHGFLEFAHSQYYQITRNAIGSYDYDHVPDNSSIPPVTLCMTHFSNTSFIRLEQKKYFINSTLSKSCQSLPQPNGHHITRNITFNFDLMVNMSLHFNITTVDLKLLKKRDPPTCYQFKITIVFDNSKHDGIIIITTSIKPVSQQCTMNNILNSNTISSDVKKYSLLVFDYIVITLCLISLVLCIRSSMVSMFLGRETAQFFKDEQGVVFTWDNYLEFVNFWFILVVVSDVCTIIGSAYKISVDRKDYDFYDACSIYLGIAVLLVWIGLLRFLGYMKTYNILLLTLQASMPNVMRFFVCTTCLFLAYMFCGWIILGPYNKKFKSLTITAETLYSLVNGDDMYNTFYLVKDIHQGIQIFSQFYLYSFISLFIYVVLSLFISIISDAYERLKDMGHLPHTPLQRFVIHGTIREPEQDEDNNENMNTNRTVRRQRIRSSAFRRYNISTESTGIE